MIPSAQPSVQPSRPSQLHPNVLPSAQLNMQLTLVSTKLSIFSSTFAQRFFPNKVPSCFACAVVLINSSKTITLFSPLIKFINKNISLPCHRLSSMFIKSMESVELSHYYLYLLRLLQNFLHHLPFLYHQTNFHIGAKFIIQ